MPATGSAVRASPSPVPSRWVSSAHGRTHDRTPLPDLEADTATFEEWRSLLFGIAYRMLGSATDAEDVIQEACIRWLRRGSQPVESVRAYLVTIVTRLCLDQLGSARARRETYTGPWLPEPVAEDDVAAVEQADSLSLAFLVLLEELTPLERAELIHCVAAHHDLRAARIAEAAVLHYANALDAVAATRPTD